MAMDVVRVEGWGQYRWLRHGFSSRAGGASEVYGPGELNLGFTAEDDRERVLGNRRTFLAGVGLAGVATVRQVHSGVVVTLHGGEAAVDADGMVTGTPGVGLGVLTADCVPVLVVDVRRRVVAALHAGWRGTAAGIAGAGVAKMREEFGCAVEDLVVAVGPSIGPCCYEVGEEFREHFAEDLFHGRRLDLWEANRQQLASAGVDSVTVVGECTACAREAAGGRRYFSHRDERGRTGRMMAAIGVCAEG